MTEIVEDLKHGAPRICELLDDTIKDQLISDIETHLANRTVRNIPNHFFIKYKAIKDEIIHAKNTVNRLLDQTPLDQDLAITNIQRLLQLYNDNLIHLSIDEQCDRVNFASRLQGIYITRVNACYREINIDRNKIIGILNALQDDKHFEWHPITKSYYKYMSQIMLKLNQIDNINSSTKNDELYRTIAILNLRIFYAFTHYAACYGTSTKSIFLHRAVEAFAQIPKERRLSLDNNLKFFTIYKIFELNSVERITTNKSECKSQYMLDVNNLLMTMIFESSFCNSFIWNIELLKILWLRRAALDSFNNLSKLSFLSNNEYSSHLSYAKSCLESIGPYQIESDRKLMAVINHEEKNSAERKNYRH